MGSNDDEPCCQCIAACLLNRLQNHRLQNHCRGQEAVATLVGRTALCGAARSLLLLLLLLLPGDGAAAAVSRLQECGAYNASGGFILLGGQPRQLAARGPGMRSATTRLQLLLRLWAGFVGDSAGHVVVVLQSDVRPARCVTLRRARDVVRNCVNAASSVSFGAASEEVVTPSRLGLGQDGVVRLSEGLCPNVSDRGHHSSMQPAVRLTSSGTSPRYEWLTRPGSPSKPRVCSAAVTAISSGAPRPLSSQ